MSVVWLVEFLHSSGWVPFDDACLARHEARKLVAKWRKKYPDFSYRVAKYTRATSPKRKTKKR